MLMEKYARCRNKKCRQWVFFKTVNRSRVYTLCPHCNKKIDFVFSKRNIQEINGIIEYERKKKIKEAKIKKEIDDFFKFLKI